MKPMLQTTTANHKTPNDTVEYGRAISLVQGLIELGIRLAVIDGKLVVVSGQLDELSRKRINMLRREVIEHLEYRQMERRLELDRRIAVAREHFIGKGHDFKRTNWLTEYEQRRFNEISEMYVSGEVDFEVVKAAFIRLANTFKRRTRVVSRAGELSDTYRRREILFEKVIAGGTDTGTKLVRCVTPQWEPTKEFADGMFQLFGINEDEYREDANIQH